MTAVARRIWGLVAGVTTGHSNGNGNGHGPGPEALIRMRGEIWREIGRLSFGHRSHLCNDPTYLGLLEERGRATCEDGADDGDPRIEDLVAKARSVDKQLQSLPGSVPASALR